MNVKNLEAKIGASIEDSQQSVSDIEGAANESIPTPLKLQIKLQSLDSLDDYKFVDYLDIVSDVLQSQNDELLPYESNHSPTTS